jgi:hypothetical protein
MPSNELPRVSKDEVTEDNRRPTLTGTAIPNPTFADLAPSAEHRGAAAVEPN